MKYKINQEMYTEVRLYVLLLFCSNIYIQTVGHESTQTLVVCKTFWIFINTISRHDIQSMEFETNQKIFIEVARYLLC